MFILPVLRISYHKKNCYTSTQNTCTWLVQITSSDVHKYAIVTPSATAQWQSALHGGTIDNSAHPEGTIWLASSSRRRRHHADAGHASLTFKTSMSTPMPNSCIVAKLYIVVFYEHLLLQNETSYVTSRQLCLIYPQRA